MKNIKTLFLIAVVIGVGAGLTWWWKHEQIHPSTDDAYLQANVITISPQVSGQVTEVTAADNQFVDSGNVLLQIDTAPLEAALQAAQAQYDIALQNAGAASSNVSEATAKLVSAKAALTQAEVTYDRTLTLSKRGDVAEANLDQVAATLKSARAEVNAAQAALDAAKSQAGSSGKNNASVQAALANLTLAQIDLARSRITAPSAGWLANVDIRPGSVVNAGSSLFSLVEDGKWWVEANFKETDLARIKPGQPVTITVDMYPGLKLHGNVESLGAGSGAVFSLLPAQNATGNWVKVTQRFPVRIAIDAPQKNGATPLRVGSSVTVTVDTAAAVDSATAGADAHQ